jgi:predicted O-methyltransferase YrrM
MPVLSSPELKKYVAQFGYRGHPVLNELRAFTAKMPASKMIIAPELSQVLYFFVGLLNPRSILEIGTYTGCSTLTMALASGQNTKIVTCDKNHEWTKIAKRYWDKAGVSEKIELKLAPALETLPTLVASRYSFDIIFIDADKANYRAYFDYALKLISQGGIIAIDNTLWRGDVVGLEITDESVGYIREFNRYISELKGIDFMLLPVDDGLTVVRKVDG